MPQYPVQLLKGAINSVLSFLVAKAKGETKILSVHKIKTNQLLRRSTAFSGTET